MIPTRWSFPEQLEAHEAEVNGDDDWGTDALAEHVAAEARVEPFWRALIIMAAVPIVAIGFAMWMSIAFGAEPIREDSARLGILQPESFSIALAAGGKQLITFRADGRIEVSPDAKPDEAAKAVIEALRSQFAALCGSPK